MKRFIVLSAVCLGGCVSLPFGKTVEPSTPEIINSFVPPPYEGVRPQMRPTVLGSDTAEVVKLGKVETPDSKTIGATVASLGDATQPGIWIKTPLVTAPQRGMIVTASGATVEADFIPLMASDTAGSQISIAAMLALGLSLTDLPVVTLERL